MRACVRARFTCVRACVHKNSSLYLINLLGDLVSLGETPVSYSATALGAVCNYDMVIPMFYLFMAFLWMIGEVSVLGRWAGISLINTGPLTP